MAQQERRLAHEMQELTADEERTEIEIEAEIRIEHWGHEPERPLDWKDRPESASSRADSALKRPRTSSEAERPR